MVCAIYDMERGTIPQMFMVQMGLGSRHNGVLAAMDD
jgi:hypothetical protein